VGTESRDRLRDDQPKGPGRPNRLAPWTIGILIVLLALFVASPRGRWLVGREGSRIGGEQRAHQGTKLPLVPGAPSVATTQAPLYEADDPWKPYLADERTCPGGERTDLPLARQADVMLCLIDWARERRGLDALPAVSLLDHTALEKAGEIVRCHDFDHAACGRSPDTDVRAAGYQGPFGENLYIAGGRYGAPRAALDGWLNSPGHRENLFRPEWRMQGIAILKLDRFGAYRDMTLWVSHFGSG
jgi:uncharacterized protein YkwD